MSFILLFTLRFCFIFIFCSHWSLSLHCPPQILYTSVFRGNVFSSSVTRRHVISRHPSLDETVCTLLLLLSKLILRSFFLRGCNVVIHSPPWATALLQDLSENPRTRLRHHSPVNFHKPPNELCPISAEQTSRDEGAEGTAGCASTANGKCQLLPRMWNNKQPTERLDKRRCLQRTQLSTENYAAHEDETCGNLSRPVLEDVLTVSHNSPRFSRNALHVRGGHKYQNIIYSVEAENRLVIYVTAAERRIMILFNLVTQPHPNKSWTRHLSGSG